MHTTLLQMALLIAAGGVWRLCKPAKLNAKETRHVVTTLVFYYLLPALIIEILWHASIGIDTLYYVLLASSSISIALLCAYLIGRYFQFDRPKLGTVLLGASFGNVTYLGLPILEQVFGDWARSVAIQMDLFACAPYLYTVGIALAKHYGVESKNEKTSLFAAFNTPPFWALGLAVILNVTQANAPIWFIEVLQKLSTAVVPLMLFSLGLALSWRAMTWQNFPYLIAVIVIKLFVMPAFAYYLANDLPLAPDRQAAAVLDLAMPSMLIGVVLCDRYHLDSALYAMMVTTTTALSVVSLPFWYSIVH